MTADPVIRVSDLTLSLPVHGDRRYAVQNVSFSICERETLCVVGESGSGKSMCAHAVMGLLPSAVRAIGGVVEFGGVDLLKMDDVAMRAIRGKDIGMVFQEPMTSLNPLMKIGDQIAETFSAHRIEAGTKNRGRIVDLLDEVGLPNPEKIASAYPHELSGGQRQRVMIAMALALEPKLLIADEPTTALDVTTQAQILKLIAKVQKSRGMAVLFITHDFGVVSEIADRIVVLKEGKVVEAGGVDMILSNPEHSYTKSLLAAVPSLSPPTARMNENAECVLRCQSIVKTYKGRGYFSKARSVVAANSVSFGMRRGETLGLVGESGSGKSTLARCCLRLIEPDEGTVFIDDVNFTALSGRELRRCRKRIQIIFQDPFASLNPRHSVARILSDGPVAHGASLQDAHAKARELLSLVGLSENAMRRYPHEFSGGQRQRIGIARALALEPEILVADEAVSALDVSVQAQILNLLREIQSKYKLAILFVTHDLRVAAQLCDRIAVMRQGEVIELRDTKALFEEPENEYTKQLLAAVPGMGRFGGRLT